jgi:adenylate cyclase class IV
MAEIEIHGHKVSFDDSSHTLKEAVKHLEKKLDSSEAKVYFDAARRNLLNHKAHFEIRDHEKHQDRNVTLIHKNDGSYVLQKRHHGIF